MTMNLADPELELIDPTPNLSSMFIHFDKTFFESRLSSRCIVRWSKRMYSCAGICTYEGGVGGLCVISLSEPLLKLRPRKDFVETLLHEMIHAYLFVTRQDQDRDGHGPNFRAHMYRINAAAGLNISIYHDFHDEVRSYQTHWWRCTGRCQFIRPHFGIVRRSINRPPGPSEYWWCSHQATCGGTFIKIKEPESRLKKPENRQKKPVMSKENGDITKYVIINNGVKNNIPKKTVLKDSNTVPFNPKIRIDNKNTSILVAAKTNENFCPQFPQPVVYNGTAINTNNGERNRTTSSDVLDTVRNAWCNKQIPSNNIPKDINSNNVSNVNIHKPDAAQMKEKILQRYSTYASSVIKELYGNDCDVMGIIRGDVRPVRVESKTKNIVDCPVCNKRIDSDKINKHLDECLNKELIQKLSQKNNPLVENDSSVKGQTLDSPVDRGQSRAIDDDLIPEIRTNKSVSKGHIDRNISEAVINKPVPNIDIIDLTNNNFVADVRRKRSRSTFDYDDLRPTEQVMGSNDKKNKFRKSNSFVEPSASNIVQQISPIMINLHENDPDSSKYNVKPKISASNIAGQTSPILINTLENNPSSSSSASNIVELTSQIFINTREKDPGSSEYNAESNKSTSKIRIQTSPILINSRKGSVDYNSKPKKSASNIGKESSPILINSWKNDPSSSENNAKSEIIETNVGEQTPAIFINSQKNELGSSDHNSKSKTSAPNIVEEIPPVLIKLEDNERGSGEYNSKSQIEMGTCIAEDLLQSITKIDQDSSNLATAARIDTEPSCINVPKTEMGSNECNLTEKACPCCGDKLNKSLDEHLDECLSFIEDDTTTPQEGASTSNATVVIDDFDIDFDESQKFNATGTKYPCPCCMKMIEEIDMNTHLDICLVNGNNGVW